MSTATVDRPPEIVDAPPSPRPVAGRPWSLGIVALVVGFAALHVLARFGDRWTTFGDVALIELSTRMATTGDQLLGAYSRYGWHHPGPVWFYVSAPFLWLTGGASRSLILAALLTNGIAALAVVAVVRRHAGEVAARWAAAVICAYVVMVGIDRLWSPWNPDVIILPAALVVVLAAAATTGSWWSLVGSAAVASLAMQGHIATVPSLGVVVLAGAAGWWWTVRGDAPAAPGWPAVTSMALGVVVVAAIWAPPAYEQLTDDRGNVTRLVDFSRNPPADRVHGHPPATAARAVGDQVAIVPLGWDVAGDGPVGRVLRVGVALAVLALGAVVWRRARAAHAPFVAAMAGLGALAVVVAVVAATRVVGGYGHYMLRWASAVVVPTWVALGLWMARRPHRRRPRLVASIATASLVVGALAAVWHTAGDDGEPLPHSPETDDAVAMVEGALEDRGIERFSIELPKSRFYLATGMVNVLYRRGRDVRVEDRWARTFAEPLREQGDEEAVVVLVDPEAGLDDRTGLVPLGEVEWSTTPRRTGQVTSLWLRVKG